MMRSLVQLHGCVRAFVPASRSLKDDHSIVNKQDICLKSCITSGEDSEEMCCAMLSVPLFSVSPTTPRIHQNFPTQTNSTKSP